MDVINFSRTHPGNDFPGASYSVDLDDSNALRRALQKLISEHSIDNLVNNAAPGEGASLDQIKMAELDRMVDVNCERQFSWPKPSFLGCAQKDVAGSSTSAAGPL